MANLFGKSTSSESEDCPSSGWTVRPSVTNRGNGGQQCPTGDHEVETTSTGWGVKIARHSRG